MGQPSDTVFDKILRKEIPATVVYEDEAVLAFRDLQPQAPIHVLVIPKMKWKAFQDLAGAADKDVAAYVKGVAKVAAHLGLKEDGYRVVWNDGADAGQTVFYIHAHILAGAQLGRFGQ